jgi:uncharacterized RDD family membrane protein YckC
MMPGLALLQDEVITAGVLPRRVLAWVADAVLLGLLGGVLGSLWFGFGLLTLGLGWHLWPLLALLPFAYSILSIASRLSATPGQALCGLAVRRNHDLGPPDLLAATLFTLGYCVTMAAGVLWLGLAVFTVRHRTLHDLLSGLVVVRRRALAAPPGYWAAPPGWRAP